MSLEHPRTPQTSSPDSSSEAMLEVHRSRLKPEVRTYADNLHTQITASLDELGIHTLDELTEASRVGTIALAQLHALQERIVLLNQAVERNAIPSFEVEERLKLREQYEAQKALLAKTGIIENLSSGREGITGIDGKEYPFPSYPEIQERMGARHEVLREKIEQGFTQLVVVPFAMPLDRLRQKYGALLLEHYQDKKLLATKKEPTDPDEPLELNESEPLYAWSEYNQADVDGKLIYYPRSFSQDHKGSTKAELLQQDSSVGWTILLLEDLPNIHGKDQGKTVGGRLQLEAGKSPQEYLSLLLENTAYREESGLMPEGQLMYALTHLEQTNQVVDDYQGSGKASYQTGALFGASGNVPFFAWDRDYRRARLGGDGPGRRDGDCGVRSAVRV